MVEEVNLNTRGRYAVMAMVELASRHSDNPVPLSDIAAKRKISLSYLEQLFAGLRKHGLVTANRGPGGGYALAKPLSDIMIADILIAAEDSTPARRELRKSEVGMTDDCPSRDLWTRVGRMMHDYMAHISLEDIMTNRLAKLTSPGQSAKKTA